MELCLSLCHQRVNLQSLLLSGVTESSPTRTNARSVSSRSRRPRPVSAQRHAPPGHPIKSGCPAETGQQQSSDREGHRRQSVHKWAISNNQHLLHFRPSAPYNRSWCQQQHPTPQGYHFPSLKRFFHLRSEKMAAIPSSGSLIATHDYYRRRLGSASSNSSCGSAEYTGEVIPHHPGLPRQDSGHWWTSFFFAKQNQSGMQNGSESQRNGTYSLANGQVTCIAKEMVLKRQQSESSENGKSD